MFCFAIHQTCFYLNNSHREKWTRLLNIKPVSHENQKSSGRNKVSLALKKWVPSLPTNSHTRGKLYSSHTCGKLWCVLYFPRISNFMLFEHGVSQQICWERKSIYPGTFILRLVLFKSSPKQRFTLNLWQLQENVAFNVGIEHQGRDSWLHPVNPMNQDKFILSKQVTYMSYKCIPNHKMTLIYSVAFVTMTSCSRYPIKSWVNDVEMENKALNAVRLSEWYNIAHKSRR